MWLRKIKDVYRLHREELEAIPDQEQREDRLVELNVQEQVLHLAKTSIIQRAWQHRKAPDIHGLVYGLKDGLLNTVFTMTPDSTLDPLYTYNDLGAD
jgi:carbonic anhydrase